MQFYYAAFLFQQDNVLTELYHYANPNDVADKPKDFEATILVRNYLLACNNIFERGLLSNTKITSSDLTTLHNIEAGYQYFEDWWERLNASGDFQPQSSAERRFISWQTWDLLRITVYGFTELVKRFLQDNSGYYMYPLKANGSAAETLFSQFKFETNSKLSSVNYASARSRVLMKKDIHGSTKAAHGCRETPLSGQVTPEAGCSRWGTFDECTTFFQLSLASAVLMQSTNVFPVLFLMSPFQSALGLPCLLLPSTIPCILCALVFLVFCSHVQATVASFFEQCAKAAHILLFYLVFPA